MRRWPSAARHGSRASRRSGLAPWRAMQRTSAPPATALSPLPARTRKSAVMRTSSLAVLVTLLAVPAHAADITDAVPGHPGVTFASLLKAAVPGLTNDKSGNWTAGTELRGTDGKTTATDLSFNSVEALTAKEHGRPRLILLTGDSQID